ncbi:MAG: sulfatase-like hydrolase/transferase [Verrucomicrobiota bacterium]
MQKHPNIILIMADDLGYGDLGCFGSDRIRTPNIDALAGRGVAFTDFHSNGAVCTPTRAALLTGCYQQRSGLEGVIYVGGPTRRTGLDPNETYSLAHALREAGYTTALYGKWHLGYRTEFNPVHHGFDQFRGYVSGNVDYHSHVDNSGVADWWDGLEQVEEDGYVTDLVNRHAADFIEEHQNEPFFLYVAHEAPHFPYQGRKDPPERFVGGKPPKDFDPWGSRPDRQAAYQEMIEAMDEGIGWIVDKLHECGLEDSTLVVFCSDNGAMDKFGSNGALRGEKGDVYEGGHRVPAIAALPGRIDPGVVSRETVMTMDLLPTFLTLADSKTECPQPLDGIDISPALFEQRPLPVRDLFWRYGVKAAIRRGQWKLVRTADTGCELFDLDSDIAESRDLSTEQPALAQQLAQALADWERDVLHNIELKA